MGELVNRILEWLLGFRPSSLGGADGWEIDFVAEFGGYVRLLLVVVFAAMVYLTVRSYRREGDAPVKVKAVLATLRIAAIVTVFLVLLRPAIVLRFVKELRSTVVVLVDDSLSMTFKDRYARAEFGDQLSASLAVEQDELAAMSRLEVARAMLDRPDGVIDALAEDHPLLLMAFSTDRTDQQYTRPLGTIDESAEGGGSDGQSSAELAAEALGALEGRGFETDISRSIRDVLDHTRGRWVAGVILISDGQITTDGGGARLQAALDLANLRPVPLYAVMVGDPTLHKNLAVISLYARDQVQMRAEVEMTATVKHWQLDGETVALSLMYRRAGEDDWVDTGVGEVITLGPVDGEGNDGIGGLTQLTSAEGDTVRMVNFTFQPQETGEFEYRVVADVLPQEEDPDDNASPPIAVRVTDQPVNVLLISGDAGWEFQYVKSFLYRSDDSYRVSVWQQNADAAINQAASTGMKLTRLPRTLAELIGAPGDPDRPGYQVVILIDPQPTDGGFDGEFVAMLREYVERHGGGLCYVAGNKYSETILLNPGPYQPLADMLPVTLATNTTADVARIREERPQPWQVRLTSYGVDHQVMRLGGSGEEIRAVWNMLPGIYWSHPVYQIKPGVRVLAEHSNPRRRTLRNRDYPEPLIAVHTPGTGRALYVGTNSTWRWRFVRDGYYQRQFWQNVINFLASSDMGKRIEITVGGERFVAGTPITVEAQASDEAFVPLATDSLELTLVNLDTGDEQPIMLTAVNPDVAGQFGGTISEDITAHCGNYRLTARGDSPDFEQNVAFKDIVIELPLAESRRKEADEEAMRTIGSRASAAGRDGNFLYMHDVDRLAELIPPGRRTTVHKQPRELWDSNLALLLIVVLLSTEWIIRKKHNMA